MSIESLQDLVPDYAKDLRLNLSSLTRQTELTKQQLWGLIVCCAETVRHPLIKEHLYDEAKEHLSEEAFRAACGAASIMGMNNIFYRFGSLVGSAEYKDKPARLRMSIIASHGVEKADFELWSLAASAITGCGTCVKSHEAQLREVGVSSDTVIAAIRVASVIHGLAVALPE